MGSDFLFDCIIIKKRKNLLTLETELLTACNHLTVKDFTKIDLYNLEQIIYGQDADFELTAENLPSVIDEFKSIIDETFKAINSRECACLIFKGYHIHLTGGISWGDAPTCAFDAFEKFNALPKCLHKLLN